MSQSHLHATRHEQLANLLRGVFQSLPPGDRVDSMEAIAARYQVSINTARTAMILLQHEGWLKVRHGSGCYVSRPEPVLPAGRHIAILSEYNLLLSPCGASFFPHIMNELRLFLHARGHSSRLYIGHVMSESPPPETATCSDFLEDLALDHIRGIAAVATLPLHSWTEQAHQKAIPIVGMNGGVDRFDAVVDPDFATAIRHAIQQLVHGDRKRPAFIGWDEKSAAAFHAAATEAGLPAHPRRTRISLPPGEPGAGWSDFREIWAAPEEKPDSVIFGDDVLFQDALPAIQSIGVRVPADLEIVVLANRGIPLPQPFPFTRLDCDPVEFAAQMGGLLLQLLAGEEPVRRQVTVPYRPATEPATRQTTVPQRQPGVATAVTASVTT